MPELKDATIEKLLDLIEQIVSADGTYKEKAARITTMACASSDSGMNLEEFASWFEEGSSNASND